MNTRLVAMAALMVAAPHAARADDNTDDLWFVSGGGNVGYSIHDTTSGLVLGGELSAGYLRFLHDDDVGNWRALDVGRPLWIGVYTDVLRDFGSDTTRFSLGPELGYSLLGLDGGLIAQVGDDGRWGWTVRGSITFAVASVYVRRAELLDDLPDSTLWEVGVLLKIPYPFGD
jgi:hypothetical protein